MTTLRNHIARYLFGLIPTPYHGADRQSIPSRNPDHVEIYMELCVKDNVPINKRVLAKTESLEAIDGCV